MKSRILIAVFLVICGIPLCAQATRTAEAETTTKTATEAAIRVGPVDVVPLATTTTTSTTLAPAKTEQARLIGYNEATRHTKGNHILALNGGMQIPLFITPEAAGATEGWPLQLGGAFGLSYQYFIIDNLTIGGSFEGSFNTTVGGRSLFIAPLAFRLGYWFGQERMEYFVALDLGMTIMRLSGKGMITPFAKIGGGVLYQFSGSWSIGGQLFLWFVPELHADPYTDYSKLSGILELGVIAAYHL